MFYPLNHPSTLYSPPQRSGWYIPDYTYAQPLRFGNNAGCGFALTDSCATSPLPSSLAPYYCPVGGTATSYTFAVGSKVC